VQTSVGHTLQSKQHNLQIAGNWRAGFGLQKSDYAIKKAATLEYGRPEKRELPSPFIVYFVKSLIPRFASFSAASRFPWR